MKKLIFFSLMLIILVSACADEGDPTRTVESYLDALVKSDEANLRKLACGAWESEARLKADSFKSVEARLEDVSCQENGKDGDYTLVTCEGKIVATYDGEDREQPLGTYRLLKEGGEWKMCGEAE